VARACTVAQSFLHSLIAALIVDTALLAWKIEAPVIRQRCPPAGDRASHHILSAVQAISPERSSALFRLEAYFDIDRGSIWSSGGTVPVGVLFLLSPFFYAANGL